MVFGIYLIYIYTAPPRRPGSLTARAAGGRFCVWIIESLDAKSVRRPAKPARAAVCNGISCPGLTARRMRAPGKPGAKTENASLGDSGAAQKIKKIKNEKRSARSHSRHWKPGATPAGPHRLAQPAPLTSGADASVIALCLSPLGRRRRGRAERRLRRADSSMEAQRGSADCVGPLQPSACVYGQVDLVCRQACFFTRGKLRSTPLSRSLAVAIYRYGRLHGPCPTVDVPSVCRHGRLSGQESAFPISRRYEPTDSMLKMRP